MNQSLAKVLVAAALVVAGIVAYSHFKSHRSVAAYCQVFYNQGLQLHNEFSNTNFQSDPIGSMATLLSAPSQLASFFGQLDAVAPEQIEPQVAQLQQSFQNYANSLGQDAADPIAGMISGLVDGLSTTPAYAAVNSWTQDNCNPPPAS